MLENGLAIPILAHGYHCLPMPKSVGSQCFYTLQVNVAKPVSYPLEDCVDCVGAAKFVNTFVLLKRVLAGPFKARTSNNSAFVIPNGSYECTVNHLAL